MAVPWNLTPDEFVLNIMKEARGVARPPRLKLGLLPRFEKKPPITTVGEGFDRQSTTQCR